MNVAIKLRDKMRANPKNDWSVEDVKRICEASGYQFLTPTRGSHWKAIIGENHVTIPARKPIKAIYIKKLIELMDREDAKKH